MPEDAAPFDLDTLRRIHVTNIGGAGMSAVATLLAETGHTVTGHDPGSDSPFLAPLEQLGVAVATGDAPALPEGVDAVVVSTATPEDHVQLVEARGRRLPVVHRQRALQELCRGRDTVAVAGTHGKTTTSALLATILAGVGDDPGFVVGAEIRGLHRSAAWGSGRLVVEADESDGTFLALGAKAAIVTNLEADHLEHWGTEERLHEAFLDFAEAVSGPVVLCFDDPTARDLGSVAGQPVTYGLEAGADYRAEALAIAGTSVDFEVVHGAERVAVRLPGAPGEHNVRNAAGALAMAHQLGVPLADAAAALAGFEGVARRFELRGEAAGVVLVDSYDHLPTEVAAALAAATAGPWRRVVCCFQPHRYSRTEALGRTFADCFGGADVLLVTDVYPAGEAPRPGVTGKVVLDAVLDAHPWRHAVWLPTLDDVTTYLSSTLREGDLCLTLGAGDLTSVPDRVLAALEARR